MQLPVTCPQCVGPLSTTDSGFRCEACSRDFGEARNCPGCGYPALMVDAADMDCASCGLIDRRVWAPVDLAAALPPDQKVCVVGPAVQRLHKLSLRMLRLFREQDYTVVACVSPLTDLPDGLHLAECLVTGGFADFAVVIDSVELPRAIFGDRCRYIALPLEKLQPDWHQAREAARELAVALDETNDEAEGAGS